jgi:hypothetical protein
MLESTGSAESLLIHVLVICAIVWLISFVLGQVPVYRTGWVERGPAYNYGGLIVLFIILFLLFGRL